MDGMMALTAFQNGRMIDALVFIGCILSIWLALRIANMTGENPESNLVAKIVSTGFGLTVIAGCWQSFAFAANTWVIFARRLTEMGSENWGDPTGAQGLIDFVGTTESSMMPTPLGMVFLLIVTVMIISLIWSPRK
jgi:hypothetical protein